MIDRIAFFHNRYGDPIDLHSFPTRRSSDLRTSSSRWSSRWTWSSPAARGIDRKSTRLNSSHVEISYAVFCLKKKTQTQTPGIVATVKLIVIIAAFITNARVEFRRELVSTAG